MSRTEDYEKMRQLSMIINDQLSGMDGMDGMMVLAGAVIVNVITASIQGMESSALEVFAALLAKAAEDGPLEKWRGLVESSFRIDN